MSYIGPFATAAEIVERSTRLIDLKLPQDPRVPQYRLWGAQTLDDAYGAPTASGVTGTGPSQILEAMRGDNIRSAGLVKRGVGLVDESTRRMTRVKFDIEDFSSVPGSGLPQDDEFLFLRVQEYNLAQQDYGTVLGAIDHGDPVLGPITVIPNTMFWGMATASITVQGNAPTNTGCTFGRLPVFHDDMQLPNPMHIVLPRRTTYLQLQVTGSTYLLVSFGRGMPMSRVSKDEGLIYQVAAGIKEILVASADNTGVGAATVPFAAHVVLAFGPE